MSIENNSQQNPKHIVVCHYPFLRKIMMFGTNLPEYVKEFGGGVGVWNIKYKNLILLIAIITLTSCSISRKVTVKELTSTSIITADNDTIPTRIGLLHFLKPGEVYNLHMLNKRCVDASVPWKKRK